MADENDKQTPERVSKVKVTGGKRASPRGLKSDMKTKSIAVIGLIIVIVLGAVLLTTPGEKEKEAPPPAQLTSDESEIGEKAWRARAQARTNEAQKEAREAQKRSRQLADDLKNQRERNTEMLSTLRNIERRMGRVERSQGRSPPSSRDSDDDQNDNDVPPPQDHSDDGDVGSDDKQASNGDSLPPPPPRPAYDASGDRSAPDNDAGRRQAQGGGQGDYTLPGDQAGSQAGNAPPAPSERRPTIFAPDIPESKKKDDGAKDVDYEKNPYAGYMPAGSFASAVLLTGLDAAASEQTKANPQPVLLRIQEEAVTPGDGSYDLSDCVAIGSGYGDISAERAYIRLSRVSCMQPSKGRVLEAQIQGYIADSDGFQGMRGKVVRRNGQLIAKSILAGFAEGIGKVGEAASQAASRRITSPNNSANTGTTENEVDLDTGDLAKAGAFGGASNAAGQIASFYLKEAQSIFPVVSVPPGRKVTIVITQGAALEWHTVKGKYIKKIKPE